MVYQLIDGLYSGEVVDRLVVFEGYFLKIS